MKDDTEIKNSAEETGSAAENEGVEMASPKQIAEWKDKAAKADEHWDRLVRQTADFENFKKRALREKQDAIKFANESLLQKLIPIVDNFEMALAASNSAEGNSIDSFKKGVEMINNLLKNSLTEAGLEEIDAMGKPFDPNWHEAVSQKETTEVPDGQVVQQMRKGYKFRERLIRPATVVVAKTPA